MFGIVQRKVQVKIMLGYWLVLSLMIGISLLALFRLNRINTTLNELINRLSINRQVAQAIVTDLVTARYYASKYVGTRNQTDLDAFHQTLDSLHALLARANTTITAPPQVALLKQIEAAVTAYHAAFQDVTELIKKRQRTLTTVLSEQELLVDKAIAALRVSVNAQSAPTVFLAFGNAQTGFYMMRLNASRYLEAGDERYMVLLEKGYQSAQQAFAHLEKNLQEATQRTNSATAKTALNTYYQEFKTLQADYQAQKKLFKEKLDVLEPEINGYAEAITAAVEQEYKEYQQFSQRLVAQSWTQLLGATVLAMSLSIGGSLLLAGRITKPLQQVMQAAEHIANVELKNLSGLLTNLSAGDIRSEFKITAQPLTVKLHDEVGQMARSFNDIIRRLAEAQQAYHHMLAYLTEMAQVAHSVGAGALGVDVTVRSPHDALGNAIARMLANLRLADAQIQQRTTELQEENAIRKQAEEALQAANLKLEDYAATLEQKVTERTAELNQSLRTIMDSLDYAQRIQHSVLPSRDYLKTFLPESFVLWMPRDVVGGDVLFAEAYAAGIIVAVLDCTGHGVPGAFMSLIAASALRRIIETEQCYDPALILQRLNREIQTLLHQDTSHAESDDGLDAGICFLPQGNGQPPSALTFAGARIPLVYMQAGVVQTIKGDSHSIGYKRSDPHYTFQNVRIPLTPGMQCYLFTDGFRDQLGGPKRIGFGMKRLTALLQTISPEPLDRQQEFLVQALHAYRGDLIPQDDITAVGFQINSATGGVSQ
jgi:serine phosphatase RsbU (regulator of sigma subunit)